MSLISDTKTAFCNNTAIKFLGFLVSGSSEDLDSMLKSESTLGHHIKCPPAELNTAVESNQTS